MCKSMCPWKRVGGVGTVSALLLLSQSCLETGEEKKMWRLCSRLRCWALCGLECLMECKLCIYFGSVCVWAQQLIGNCRENLQVFTFQIYAVFPELSVSLLSQLRKRTTASIHVCRSIDRMQSHWHKAATMSPVQSLIHYIIRFWTLNQRSE